MLRDQQAVQVLVGDPEADRREVELLLSLGHRSLLMVPVVSQGESLGIVEAYSRLERPWTRTQINHARIISNQFGSVIMALFRAPAGAGLLAQDAASSETCTRIFSASSPPRACSRPSTSTNSGPPKGWAPVTRSRAPGRMPRSAR